MRTNRQSLFFNSSIMLIRRFVLSLLFLFFLYPSYVHAACGGSISCCEPLSEMRCGGTASGDSCSSSANCDIGVKCSIYKTCTYDTVNCSFPNSLTCSVACKPGYDKIGGSCYPIATPPPSATCGGGPACVSPQVCCQGRECMDAAACQQDNDEDDPVDTGSCSKATETTDCPGGCCDEYTSTCTFSCGGGCSVDTQSDVANISVRFIMRDGFGGFKAIKGTKEEAPIKFRLGIQDNHPSSTFSIYDYVAYPAETGYANLDANGVPFQFKSYDSGSVKQFDWTKNEIVDGFEVEMITPGAGETVEITNNCGLKSWVTRHGPPVTKAWALHMCARGLAKQEAEDGLLDGTCRLATKGCNPGSERSCLKWCRSDVDGCADPEAQWNLNNWKIERPPEPWTDGATNLGSHESLNKILKNGFRAKGLAEESRYDGYFTYNAQVFMKIYSWRDIHHTLVYTTPPGNTCGTITMYKENGSKHNLYLLNDQEKIYEGIDPDKCAIRFIGSQLQYSNFVLVEFEKDYYNQCYVDVNGQSDVLINTNTTSPWSTQQQISVVGISNEDRVANGGQTRLFLQKEGGQNFSPPAGFSGTDGTTGFLATNWTDPVTFITTYAYRWYENCISQNDIACTIPTGSSLVSPRIGFTTAYWNHLYNPTEHLPPGVYYAHCDMVNGDDKCSGNPLYQINGGTQPLDASWQSCAESTTGGFIEEIAIRNNVPMYRRTPVKQDTGLPEAISVQPMQGPFDHQAGIFANGDLLINSLGIYDLLDRSPMASIAHLWMTDNNTGEQAMYAYTIPYSNGFPNWNLATLTPSGPYPLSSFNLVVPDNEDYELTSYTTWYNPENQKVNESIWISTASQKHYGYWRWVGLNANGTLNYATAGPWTSGTDLNLPGSGYNSFPLAGISNVMIPTPTGEYGFVQAITRRSSGQAYADFLRYQRSVSDWDGQTHSTLYMPPITAPFEQDSGLIGEQFFGVGRDEFQAYEAHYIPSNVSDYAKITVQCLPSMNCDRCSEGGEDDGCGGTCERGEIPDLGAPTITSVESSRTLVGDYPDYKDIIINWTPPEDALPGDILEYQLLVYPDSSEFADKSIDEIYAEELAGSEAIALYSVSGTTTTTRQVISNGSNPKSYPKMVVAIRAKFLCRAGDEGEYSDWGTTTKTFTSSISFEYLMLDNDDSCPPAGGEVPTNPLLSGLTLNQLATTLKASSGDGFPAGLRPGEGSEETKVPIDNSGTIGNVFSNLWVYPSSWYGLSGEGWFQLTPPDLKTVGFDVACIVPSAVSNKYRNPVPNANPADDFSNPPIIIYLKPYAQPWWQVQGGSIWADNSVIKSLIPAMCTGSCVNSLIRNISASPNPLAGSAGIPIANNSITISAGAGNGASFSDIDGNARAENVGQLAKHPFSYDQFIQDMNIFLSAHPTYSKINITDLSVPQINDELLDPAKGLDLEGNKQLFILESQGDTTLEFSATEENQIDLQGDIQVILMVDGDLTLRGTDDTLSLTNAINVPDSSYFQVISTGNITIEGELGTPPGEIDPAQPISTLEGIYVALGNLIIKGLDDPDEIDNQFVGKGSFAGLGGVTLGRSLVDALGASNLNDQNPSELFIHHPPYVLQTPEFLRQPMLTYQEQ